MSQARIPPGAKALAALAFLLLPAAALAADEARVRARERVQVVVPREREAVVLDGGRRGFLGVHVIELTPELRRHFQAGEDNGVMVSRVEEDSPAAAAGIEVGDVLLAVDGEEVASARDLRRAVAPRRRGDAVGVEVVRGGRQRTLTATLDEREGHVLELGSLLQRDGEGRPLLVLPSAEEWEELGARMGDIGQEMGLLGEEMGAAVAEAMADPHVRLRIEGAMRDREQLQRKIELLERRLRELERRLGEQRR